MHKHLVDFGCIHVSDGICTGQFEYFLPSTKSFQAFLPVVLPNTFWTATFLLPANGENGKDATTHDTSFKSASFNYSDNLDIIKIHRRNMRKHLNTHTWCKTCSKLHNKKTKNFQRERERKRQTRNKY